MILLPLNACAPVQPSLNADELKIVAPDVPHLTKAQQGMAAIEMQGRACPTLNNIVNQCLRTADETRVIK